MKKFLLIIGLIATGLLSVGCCSVNPERVKAIKKEIADIGSDAQISGPRDAAEIERINAQILKIWTHEDELNGTDPAKTTPDLKKKP